MEFSELYRDYYQQMLFVALKILRNRDDAEDAVQNALLKLYRNRKHIPTDPCVRRAYILTAAKYAALDLKEQRTDDADLDEVVVATDHDLFEEIAASEDYDRLLQAINALPLRYREVLMLRYVQECSISQIAQVLHRTPFTVRKQISRGKSLLQNAYFKKGGS